MKKTENSTLPDNAQYGDEEKICRGYHRPKPVQQMPLSKSEHGRTIDAWWINKMRQKRTIGKLVTNHQDTCGELFNEWDPNAQHQAEMFAKETLEFAGPVKRLRDLSLHLERTDKMFERLNRFTEKRAKRLHMTLEVKTRAGCKVFTLCMPLQPHYAKMNNSTFKKYASWDCVNIKLHSDDPHDDSISASFYVWDNEILLKTSYIGCWDGQKEHGGILGYEQIRNTMCWRKGEKSFEADHKHNKFKLLNIVDPDDDTFDHKNWGLYLY